jgi:hypothetical protein
VPAKGKPKRAKWQLARSRLDRSALPFPPPLCPISPNQLKTVLQKAESRFANGSTLLVVITLPEMNDQQFMGREFTTRSRLIVTAPLGPG